jgi:two-component system cell cycle sensor histidine kinase/response regulator CckA
VARVLIVEDEAAVLILAESVLQTAGYKTVSAGTVAEAQAIINDPEQKIDLVFTDIGLGSHKEGGITVGQLVTKARPGTPVLYTSGRPVTDGMKALFAERSAYLTKPYTVQELAQELGKLLPPSPS